MKSETAHAVEVDAEIWETRCRRYEAHMSDCVPMRYWPEYADVAIYANGKRVWTREDLDRDHPLPDGWSWGFQFVDDDSDEIDPTRPWAFGQAPSGHDCCVEVIDGKLRAYDITETHFDPPADVVLAVLLANRTRGGAS